MMTTRPKPITELYAFLVEHHHVNAVIQHGFIGESLSPATVDDRALLLMHRVLQTQSRPKLDPICQFFSRVRDERAHRTFAAFRKLVTADGKLRVVDGLALQPGWGAKTAALFVRNLAYIESTPKLRAKFWRDTRVLEGDQLRLPVDAVILTIFETLAPRINWPKAISAPNVGRYFHNDLGYRDEELLVWDDLWFWGFVTQKTVQGRTRELGWNESKYWAIPHAPRDRQSIADIRRCSERFLKLICAAK
ncbi:MULTISPECIES: hypothetical protein [Burkholderia]|uniref:hypothetical protein n=1 Tax=Burkholderia TaxID=32008 RepID=UPI001199EA08|nr:MULTISPECIES: hypothetical protein [Burkholderia]TWC59554.1 hypothetical protein FB600_13239 [Burkholderia sp. SJZ089]TWC94056.1 hypothetical protein FBX98_1323 [Burkholderia sp. SJZ115]TWC96230.1 hypothetical protein FB601_1323 [Burkholderia sp. SJZ091]